MVQVLVKAFKIIELVVQRNGQPIWLPEISNELQINEATALNIINTMVSLGYLEHIGKKKGYRLGPATYRLTNEVPYGEKLVNVAKDIMEALTAKLNESCIIGVLRNHKRYILHAVNATHEVQVNLSSERNIYETASGRLLLAYLSEKELNRFIQQNGLPDAELWEEASTTEGLIEAFEKIREDGIVITHLKNRHVKGFAAPVYSNEQVVAALSIFLPEYRCSAARQKEIVQSLKTAAVAISQKLIE